MVTSFLTNHDRWFFIQLYRWFPLILQVLTIIRPRRWCVGMPNITTGSELIDP
jgi:hypothetical protein